MQDNKKLWIETFSGKKINPLNAETDDIEIEDIAHSLAMQCRFNGHCLRFYSVAEHCVNTARLILNSDNSQTKYHVALFALLHDASEAYLCDIPRPLKKYIKSYKKWEDKLSGTIFAKFAGRKPKQNELEKVMAADNAMLAVEAAELTLNKGKDWLLDNISDHNIKIKCLSWKKAKKEYIAIFNYLIHKLALSSSANKLSTRRKSEKKRIK